MIKTLLFGILSSFLLIGCEDSSVPKPRQFYYYPEVQSTELNSTLKLATDYQDGKVIYHFAIYMRQPSRVDFQNTKVLFLDSSGFQIADADINLNYNGWNQPSYYGEGSKPLDSLVYAKILGFKFYDEMKHESATMESRGDGVSL